MAGPNRGAQLSAATFPRTNGSRRRERPYRDHPRIPHGRSRWWASRDIRAGSTSCAAPARGRSWRRRSGRRRGFRWHLIPDTRAGPIAIHPYTASRGRRWRTRRPAGACGTTVLCRSFRRYIHRDPCVGSVVSRPYAGGRGRRWRTCRPVCPNRIAVLCRRSGRGSGRNEGARSGANTTSKRGGSRRRRTSRCHRSTSRG